MTTVRIEFAADSNETRDAVEIISKLDWVDFDKEFNLSTEPGLIVADSVPVRPIYEPDLFDEEEESLLDEAVGEFEEFYQERGIKASIHY